MQYTTTVHPVLSHFHSWKHLQLYKIYSLCHSNYDKCTPYTAQQTHVTTLVFPPHPSTLWSLPTSHSLSGAITPHPHSPPHPSPSLSHPHSSPLTSHFHLTPHFLPTSPPSLSPHLTPALSPHLTLTLSPPHPLISPHLTLTLSHLTPHLTPHSLPTSPLTLSPPHPCTLLLLHLVDHRVHLGYLFLLLLPLLLLDFLGQSVQVPSLCLLMFDGLGVL